MIEDLGHTAIEAHSGAEALAQARARASKVDVRHHRPCHARDDRIAAPKSFREVSRASRHLGDGLRGASRGSGVARHRTDWRSRAHSTKSRWRFTTRCGQPPRRIAWLCRGRPRKLCAMKFCVYGAGAIGGYLAVELALSGQEVSVVARGAHLEAIRKRGLTLKIHGAGKGARWQPIPIPAPSAHKMS